MEEHSILTDTTAHLHPAIPRRTSRKGGASGGFTLLEMLFVLFWVSLITVALGSTAFQERRSLLVWKHADQLYQSLILARNNTAISLSPTTICPSTDSHSCSDSVFSAGWIVFTDTPDSIQGTFDGADILIRSYRLTKQPITINTNSFSRFIRYNPSGTANASGRFILCWNNQPEDAQVIVISSNGRIRKAADSDQDGIPEPFGTNIDNCEI